MVFRCFEFGRLHCLRLLHGLSPINNYLNKILSLKFSWGTKKFCGRPCLCTCVLATLDEPNLCCKRVVSLGMVNTYLAQLSTLMAYAIKYIIVQSDNIFRPLVWQPCLNKKACLLSKPNSLCLNDSNLAAMYTKRDQFAIPFVGTKLPQKLTLVQ